MKGKRIRSVSELQRRSPSSLPELRHPAQTSAASRYRTVSLSPSSQGMRAGRRLRSVIRAGSGGDPGQLRDDRRVQGRCTRQRQDFPGRRQNGEGPLEPNEERDDPGQPLVPNTLHDIDFMVKDSKRFADSGGWGYAEFEYDGPAAAFRPGTTADQPPQGNDAKCGFACHTVVKKQDYVFTEYPKR